MSDWSDESWSKIALETAHRAAVYGQVLGSGTRHYLEEAEPLTGLHGPQTLSDLSERPRADEWYWVYAPILQKLLAGPAVLVGLGNHLVTAANGLRRHWLNFVPADFEGRHLTDAATLENKALALIGCNAKDPVAWSTTVALTTELAETRGNGAKLLGPLVVSIDGCDDIRGIDGISLVKTSMPDDVEAKPSLTLNGGTLPLTFSLETWNGLALNGYPASLSSRAKQVTHKFPSGLNDRVSALCVWLADILRARCNGSGGTIVTVPGWLTPTEIGMPSGSITVYLKKDAWFADVNTPDSRYEALAAFASAYHSGSMAYIARFERRQREYLEKVASVFNLLQRPLDHVTKAVRALQMSSQELQAVLYEPSATLFGSHRQLTPCFEPVDQSDMTYGQCHVLVLHKPSDYGSVDSCAAPGCEQPLQNHAQWVAAIAICRIFGKDESLRQSPSGDVLLARAHAVLSELSTIPQFNSLYAAIGAVAGSFKAAEDLHVVIGDATKARLFLTHLKECVFTPFKVTESTWPPTALKLVTWGTGRVSGTSPRWSIPRGLSSIVESRTWAPLTYSALLQFLSKAVHQFTRSRRGFVTTGTVSKKQDRTTITLGFSDNYCERDGIATLRDAMRRALAVPREWRLEHSNVGDFTGPFVELASHVLDFAADSTRATATEWTWQEPRRGAVVLDLRRKQDRRRCAIAVTGKRLQIAFGTATEADHARRS